MTSCDFCNRMETNNNLLYSDDQVAVFFDIDPISKGHILICPREHYDDFHLIPDEVILEMMKTSKKYIYALQQEFDIPGYSMMLNAMAYNDLGHCHLHLFPRNSSEEFGWTYADESLINSQADIQRLKMLLAKYLE